jgi:hypothetical protein
LISRTLESTGASPAAAIGTSAALEVRETAAPVPVRSTLAACTAAVLGLVAVSVVGASMDRLAQTPTLHGFDWHVGVDDSRAEYRIPDRPCSGLLRTRVETEPALEAIAGVCLLNVEIEGHPVGAFGFSALRGRVAPTLIEGRAPRADDEVVLGTATLDTIGRSIGDPVRAEGPAGSSTYTVVGRAAIPALGDSTQALADGAIFTGPGLDRLDDPRAELSHGWVVVRFEPGADARSSVRRFARLPGVGDPETSGVSPAVLPLEVRRLQQVDDLPYALAGFLALLGATAIGYALVTSIRQRRLDLAILKTLGLRRRQLAASIAWQATTVALVGIVLGIPLGIIIGRVIWRAVVERTGVVFSPDIPTLTVTAVAVVTILFANVVAYLPARLAARTSPSVTLKTE